MKKILLIIFFVVFNTKAFAGTNCGLVFDNWRQSYSTNYFTVYNPTLNTIRVQSIRYNKDRTLWREYNLTEIVYSKTSKTFSHVQELPTDITGAFINCEVVGIYNPPVKQPEKNSGQKILDKILGK